jgi:hypothetical protein
VKIYKIMKESLYMEKKNVLAFLLLVVYAYLCGASVSMLQGADVSLGAYVLSTFTNQYYILFALFIWRGILIAIKAPDMFGSLLAVGITSLIGLQAIINIAVVTSSMPVTGIALPFFSYGGTSLIILLCAVGVLLNISRQTEKI